MAAAVRRVPPPRKIDVPFDEAAARPAIDPKPNLAACASEGGTFCPGAPWALCITPGHQVLYVSDAYPGRRAPYRGPAGLLPA